MSILQVMDTTGDNEIAWDPGNADQVAVARAAFDVAKGRGMVAYSVDDKGGAGSVLHRFDPEAGRIVMRPAMQGG
jgi:hypothetical protein